jgi:hypothetical protein
VPWDQDTPPTDLEGYQMLDELHAKLTPAEQRERERAFAEARSYIAQVAAAGGASTPPRVSKSFPRKALKGGIRVDIEVLAGMAFVPH